MSSSAARSVGATVCLLLVACGGSGDESPSPGPGPGPLPSPCTYSLSTRTHTFGSDGGTLRVTVTTDAACSWSASTQATWLALADAGPRTGSGAVTITAAPLAAAQARTAVVTVAEQAVSITQEAAACSITLSPDGASRTATGGSGRFDVSTAAGCAWRAASTVSWLQVRAPLDEARGPGSVEYGLDANVATAERTGTITVGTAVYTVRQSGASAACAYTLSATQLTLVWYTERSRVVMDTAANCAWTVRSTVPWLTLPDGANRSGPGDIIMATTQYTGDRSREGVVEVRWVGPREGENIHVRQVGCAYGFSPLTQSFPAAGGTGRVDVLAGSWEPISMVGCPWTVVSEVPWMRVTSGSPNAGDNPFHFVVDPNSGGARSGRFLIADRPYVVTQAGATIR